MKQIFGITISISVFCASIFWSCNHSKVKAEEPYLKDSAHTQYMEYCSGCHGIDLQKFQGKDWTKPGASSTMYAAIKNGIEEEGMPAYDSSFTDVEIENMVTYLIQRQSLAIASTKKRNIKVESYSTDDYEIVAEKIANNLEIPWAMQMLPAGEILFTEKQGKLKKLLPDGKILDIDAVPAVRNRGQGGLLDVKLHPDFVNNQLIFLSFSKPKSNDEDLGTTAVVVAKLVGNKLEDVKEIFEAKPYVGASHHYAGRLQFDKNKFLFISVGDRGDEDKHPQDLSNSCGKIHRINADGTIPGDNPFVNDKKAIASIYSYGHRNQQGLALSANGNLWENEHGPKGGDEINKIVAGKNYGWPLATFGVNYDGSTITENQSIPGLEDPVKHWTPSIAPSSMCFVTGNIYHKWNNNLLSSSLKFDYVSRCVLDGDKIVKEEEILKSIGRIRNVVQLADGYIYVAVENPGRIYRLVISPK